MAETKKMEVVIVSEEEIRDKIFVIRGQKAMLDEDLALIYGYTTKRFNQQVRNNIAKFDDDFRFQLTDEEVEELSRSNILTSMQEKGSKGGRTYNPYVFTEAGIYMLMTVLRGDLAVKQSKALIRLFKGMKDYLIESPVTIGQDELLRMSIQTSENTRDIKYLKEEMATKSDLEEFLVNFSDNHFGKEFLLVDGKTIEAEVAYSDIYKTAKKSIYIVDNYIGVKTLLLLKDIPAGVNVTIFSDNKAKLTLLQFQEFCKEYPQIKINFRKTCDRFHDRFIVLDYSTKGEKIYHCGGSSKDGGNRTTVLSRLEDIQLYDDMIKELLNNPSLKLK